MVWVFLGHALMTFAAFAAEGVRQYAAKPRSMLSFFFLLPLVVIALGCEAFVDGNPEDRDTVREALNRGLLRRRTAMTAGGCTAAVAFGASWLLFKTDGFWTNSQLFVLIGSAICFFAAPAVACGWVMSHAREVLATDRGFPVQPRSPRRGLRIFWRGRERSEGET